LQWNAEDLKITNHSEAQNWITKRYRKNWEPTWT